MEYQQRSVSCARRSMSGALSVTVTVTVTVDGHLPVLIFLGIMAGDCRATYTSLGLAASSLREGGYV